MVIAKAVGKVTEDKMNMSEPKGFSTSELAEWHKRFGGKLHPADAFCGADGEEVKRFLATIAGREARIGQAWRALECKECESEFRLWALRGSEELRDAQAKCIAALEATTKQGIALLVKEDGWDDGMKLLFKAAGLKYEPVKSKPATFGSLREAPQPEEGGDDE